MFKKNLIVKTLAASALLAASGAALATEVTVQASTTVNNAIDLTVAGTLNFGTIRATIGTAANDCAGLILPANPNQSLSTTDSVEGSGPTPILCGTDGTNPVAVSATIDSIDEAIERPEFTVAGLAPFTDVSLNAINGGEDAIIEIEGAPDTIANFVLTNWTAYQTSGFTPQDIDLTQTGNITADNTGSIIFTVGATLVTVEDPTAVSGNYQDSAYTGDFTVEVVY